MFTTALRKGRALLAALVLLGTVLVMIQAGASAAPLRASPVAIRVSASADDAEEMASGSVDLDSSDLELVYDTLPESLQTVGVRFNSVDIPQGATITSAYVQFRANSSKSGTVIVAIHGEDIDDAPTFTSANYDITNRTYTTASVNWQPPQWSDNDEGEDQQTSDISTVIQEIVDRVGWEEGNSLAVIFNGTEEEYLRKADSYDDYPAGAPELNVTYTTGATPTPTSEPTVTPSSTPAPGSFLDLSDTPGEYSGAYHLLAINSEADGLVEVPDIAATGSGLFSGGLIWSGSYIQSNSYIQGGTGIEATTGNVEAVTGDVIAGDDVLVTDDLVVGGDIYLSGLIQAEGGTERISAGSLEVDEDVDVGRDLTVDRYTILDGAVWINGLVQTDLIVHQGIHAHGNIGSDGWITATYDITAGDDLVSDDDVLVGDDLVVDGSSFLMGPVSFYGGIQGSVGVDGNFGVTGGLEVGDYQGPGPVVVMSGGHIYADGNIAADGDMYANNIHLSEDVIAGNVHADNGLFAGYATDPENYTGQTIHTRSLIALDNNMGGTFFYANDNVTDTSIKLFDSDDVGGPKWIMSFRYLCAENGDEAATLSQGNLLLVPGRTEYICNLGRTGEYVEIRWWIPSSGGEMRMEASPGETFRVVLDAIWLND